MTDISRRGLAAAAAVLPLFAIGSARAESGTEFTFDRIQRTKVLRIAALPGELPYFRKDLATGEWSGAAVSMALDIAKIFDAKLEYLESTYGNSVLDLQANKVDLAFALNPTPVRALSISFTHPVIIHPFGCLARSGLSPAGWDDINKPDIRIAVDLGSLHETAARRFAPKAQITAFKTRDDCILALQSGRVDVDILAAILGISAVAKNPSLGPYHLLQNPLVALPSCAGYRRESDTRFADVLNAWVDYNRGIGQIREWMLGGLQMVGAKPEDVPSQLSF
jgi:polar amino acid transport system substrate-binding protein